MSCARVPSVSAASLGCSIFYVFAMLPAIAVDFGIGNIHIRFFSLFFIPFLINKFNRLDFLFVFAAVFHAVYATATYSVRPFHYLDVGYIVTYLYIFAGLAVVRSDPYLFLRMVKLFWVLNVCYAVYQNIALLSGFGNEWVFWHQNTHSEHYEIPKASFLPLYRVTGLFGESAPFVIYLMFTHFAFGVMGVKREFRLLNIVAILLAGAKIGYLFVLLLFVQRGISRFRWFLPVIYVVGIVCLVYFLPLFVDLLGTVDMFTSAVNRAIKMNNSLNEFLRGEGSALFGHGFFSSNEIIRLLSNRTADTFIRGNDFFSVYIFSVGVVGTLLLLLPIVSWFGRHVKSLRSKELGDLYLVLVLALITAGSLKNFQYAYLVFVLGYVNAIEGLPGIRSNSNVSFRQDMIPKRRSCHEAKTLFRGADRSGRQAARAGDTGR